MSITALKKITLATLIVYVFVALLYSATIKNDYTAYLPILCLFIFMGTYLLWVRFIVKRVRLTRLSARQVGYASFFYAIILTLVVTLMLLKVLANDVSNNVKFIEILMVWTLIVSLVTMMLCVSRVIVSNQKDLNIHETQSVVGLTFKLVFLPVFMENIHQTLLELNSADQHSSN